MPRILIADDEPRIIEALQRLLKLEGYDAIGAPDGEAALAALGRGGWDAVLLDLDMPKQNGLETLRALRAAGDSTPVIIVSGRGTIQRAVEAVRLGAHDFVEKPIDDERLLMALQRALAFRKMSAEVERLREDQEKRELIAESAGLKKVLAEARRVAATDSTVLVTGETGAGKELVAQLIHRESARRNGPLVKVNCAALPAELAESELFGHVRGAFTGAVKERRGRFQLADRGTLFLDEVGEIPPALQPKLLRALGEGEFEPVGGEKTEKAEVRVIAATNRDLAAAVKENRFRADLYYRLAVIVLAVPPLRERPEDAAALARHFLERFGRKTGRPDLAFSAEALVRLQTYAWPGNVRELRNLVERLAVTAPEAVISAEEIAAALPASPREPLRSGPAGLADSLAVEEARLIRAALEQSGGNVAAAARALGLERSHFYKKMKKHGIE